MIDGLKQFYFQIKISFLFQEQIATLQQEYGKLHLPTSKLDVHTHVYMYN